VPFEVKVIDVQLHVLAEYRLPVEKKVMIGVATLSLHDAPSLGSSGNEC
jgi:hypothetical protein